MCHVGNVCVDIFFFAYSSLHEVRTIIGRKINDVLKRVNKCKCVITCVERSMTGK